jgi:hypothetical protein
LAFFSSIAFNLLSSALVSILYVSESSFIGFQSAKRFHSFDLEYIISFFGKVFQIADVVGWSSLSRSVRSCEVVLSLSLFSIQ